MTSANRHLPGIVSTPVTRAFRQAALIVGGSLALALSAKVQVPFWPVPATMQTLVVLMIGYVFGSRLGAMTVLAYLAEGLAGLPVFAGALAGPAYLLGPTGGYLLGFIPAVLFAGWAAGWRRPQSLAWTSFAMLMGHAMIFVPGAAWLAVLVGWHKAFALGVAPFLLATLVKSGLAGALVSVFRTRQGTGC
jgi:biotin transport system substrate-specific component